MGTNGILALEDVEDNIDHASASPASERSKFIRSAYEPNCDHARGVRQSVEVRDHIAEAKQNLCVSLSQIWVSKDSLVILSQLERFLVVCLHDSEGRFGLDERRDDRAELPRLELQLHTGMRMPCGGVIEEGLGLKSL